MTPAWANDPIGALTAFSRDVGIPTSLWQDREEPTRLTYAHEALRRDRVASLRLDRLTALTDTFGDALSVRVLLGGLNVLDIRPGVSEAELDSFRELTAESPTVALDFVLDKTRLAAHWFGQRPHHRVFLFLFESAMTRLLSSTLPKLETLLWDTETDARVALLGLEGDDQLEGEWLSVATGPSALSAWAASPPALPPDVQRAHDACALRADRVRWQERWLTHITPLHLQLSQTRATSSSIAELLRTHLTNLVLLYTADRVTERGAQWVATYASTYETVDIPLSVAATLPRHPSAEEAVALGQLFEWVYQPTWAVDRLLFVQIIVAHALGEVEVAIRYRHFVERADATLTELLRQWKSFVEGRVSAYTDQVRALEEDVAKTVQGFTDQVAAIIKSLSDTMLAAVAALLASFIASIFQSDFNKAVFQLGLAVYAGYVVCFPLTYNMLFQWRQYARQEEDFGARRKRFEERLSDSQVTGIVGNRIERSVRSFQCWFKATIALYLVVIALAMAAAVLVPVLVAQPGPATVHHSVPVRTATPVLIRVPTATSHP